MSDVYQALSSPVRRKILSLLKDRDMSAGELAESVDVAKSTLSGHFNILKNANLIISNKIGTTVTYSINTSVVEDLLSHMFELFGNSNAAIREK